MKTYYSRSKRLPDDWSTTSMIDHKAYVWYRNNSKLVSRADVADFVEYGKIMTAFYKIVAKEIAETKGGVFIDNFGYFGVLKYLKPSYTTMDFALGERVMVTGDKFWLGFVPISKNNKRKLFTFDLSFSKILTKQLSNNLSKGYRYMFNASMFFYKLKKGTS